MRRARRIGHALPTAYGLARLSAEDRTAALQPARDAVRQFAAGVAMPWHWRALHRCIELAQAIEREGIVRGAGGHLAQAAQALQMIEERSRDRADNGYHIPHLEEMRCIEDALDIHALQLQSLTRVQYRQLTLAAPVLSVDAQARPERAAVQEALSL